MAIYFGQGLHGHIVFTAFLLASERTAMLPSEAQKGRTAQRNGRKLDHLDKNMAAAMHNDIIIPR